MPPRCSSLEMVSSEAAAGARDWPSIAITDPPGCRINTTVWPPNPDPLGSQTQSAHAAATAASTPWPPSARIPSAASVAAGDAVAATLAMLISLRKIVEPAGALAIGPREYLADSLELGTLVVAHVQPVVTSEIQDF